MHDDPHVGEQGAQPGLLASVEQRVPVPGLYDEERLAGPRRRPAARPG